MHYGRLCSAFLLIAAIPASSLAAAQERHATPPPSRSPSTREIAANATRALVVVLNLDAAGEVRSFGSGFVFRSGVVATNFHVVDGANRIMVRRSGKEESFRAKLVKTSPQLDLAVLSVDGLTAAPLAIGQSSAVAVGDSIFAAGNPKGLEATFSDGLVSARRTLGGVELLQITAPISPGSSGGPVLDRQGRVIGVAVGKVEGGDLLNFAIPVSQLIALESDQSQGAGASTDGSGSDSQRSREESLDDLFESFRLQAIVADLWDGHAAEVKRSIRQVSLNGNWLVLEVVEEEPGQEATVTECELLLSDVVSVVVVDDGIAAFTDGKKVKVKVTIGQTAKRSLTSNVFVPSTGDFAMRSDFAASLESMVTAAKASPAGDVRTSSGPSAEATIEFIRSQLAMHGSSKGTSTNNDGVRVSREQRVRSFDVRDGTLSVVVVVEAKYLTGRRAGDTYTTTYRTSALLADLSAAGSLDLEETATTGIMIGAIDGEPVTEETEYPSGNVESQARGGVLIPIADSALRERIIKAINHLLDLANARKEPDPF